MIIIRERINGTRKLVSEAIQIRNADFIRDLALGQWQGPVLDEFQPCVPRRENRTENRTLNGISH